MKRKLTLIAMGLCFAAVPVIGQANSGESTYKRSCKMCHSSGMMGAPKLGDKKAWAPLIATGHEELTKMTIKGKGRMMPRGGCRTCSDEDISVAVEYIIQHSK